MAREFILCSRQAIKKIIDSVAGDFWSFRLAVNDGFKDAREYLGRK